jgi:ribonuclease HII
MTVGIDEVGRGCLAGPVCVAAVAWPNDANHEGLADSKKLTALKREVQAARIRREATCVGIGWASAAEIDALGMTKALKLAANKALSQIAEPFDEIIVDGRDSLVSDSRERRIIKADGSIPAVMAASIVAKVARDAYMHAMHLVYAEYQFMQHVGYATPTHRAMLHQFGPCQIHRRRFGTVKALVAEAQ